MTMKQKTTIVTGASQAIGAAAPSLFLDRGYNVVGNSRKIGRKNELPRSDSLALVDGDIGLASTAQAKDIAEAAAIAPNLDQDTFDRLAQDAEQNCPISRVLKAEITLNARLV